MAVDVADAAVSATDDRLRGRAGVEVRQLSAPDEWPDGRFDLVVLSEVGYYLSRDDLGELVRKAAGSLDPDGALLAVHWRHPVADYPLSGDEVHAGDRDDVWRSIDCSVTRKTTSSWRSSSRCACRCPLLTPPDCCRDDRGGRRRRTGTR